MMVEDRHYWFRRKTYGIGWSLPAAWQGWVVVLVFLTLLFAGLSGIDTPQLRLGYLIALGLSFVAVVVWKGERPVKWRWGRD
jgi:hypothetical protein